ncbi:MAG: hypothetical protein ACM359_17595 [Bacillota bacterium]
MEQRHRGRTELTAGPPNTPMANYIPWYGKKRERLARHEEAFLSLLQNETDLKRLRDAAEMVRLAQVRALEANPMAALGRICCRDCESRS